MREKKSNYSAPNGFESLFHLGSGKNAIKQGQSLHIKTNSRTKEKYFNQSLYRNQIYIDEAEEEEEKKNSNWITLLLIYL